MSGEGDGVAVHIWPAGVDLPEADGTMKYSTEDGTAIATYERRGRAPGCE